MSDTQLTNCKCWQQYYKVEWNKVQNSNNAVNIATDYEKQQMN